MKKWMAKDGNYTYTIKESVFGGVDLNIDHLGDEMRLWFQTYKSARNYLRREEDFTGRMKLVKEDAE
ncbi:hypothetical protein ABET08_16055 [Bacillus subtilis]